MHSTMFSAASISNFSASVSIRLPRRRGYPDDGTMRRPALACYSVP